MSTVRGVVTMGLIALIAACAASPDRAQRSTFTLFEDRGEYRGVAIGDPLSAVRSAFGRPAPLDRAGQGHGTFAPPDASIPSLPSEDQIPPFKSDRYYGYKGVTFLMTGNRVRGLLVWDRQAQTRRGVAPGDPLAEAKERYRRLICATQRGEGPHFDYCVGRGGPPYLWFGGDPINVIVLLNKPILTYGLPVRATQGS